MSRPTRATLSLVATLGLVTSAHSTPSRRAAVERITINDNRVAAGSLERGVLTVHLEAREGEWHPDGDNDPGVVVRAFAETSNAASIPGPLIRVLEGTEIHAFIKNSISDSILTIHGLSTRGGPGEDLADSIQIRRGETREVRFLAGAPGAYYYWATTTTDGGLAGRKGIDAELSGAFVVDPRGTPARARDRVLVIGLWTRDSTTATGIVASPTVVTRFTINGRAWPHTERLSYSVGDSARFRILNVSPAAHPMHLHGFYFNVESRGDATRDSIYDPKKSPRMVVTDRVAPGRTMSLTWIPERAGNWMFHCHDNLHVLRSRPLDGSPLPAPSADHVMNHAMDMMGGLVMGIEVRPKPGTPPLAERTPSRRLRLVARVDTGGTSDEPAFGYVLQERGTAIAAKAPMLPGPTIILKRGEPVSITVVNELAEATAVHWHGIELDSYYDGVAGFAGHPGHVAPAIAPRDSFEARFTPPRAGTFIYHPHADEVRQQQAGLSGAIVVVDAAFDSTKDFVFLITVPRRNANRGVVLLNGTHEPRPLELRAGERYRLRLIDIHTYRPSMIARVLRDSTPVTWRAIAKDGRDLPADQATIRPAVQQMGNGETYDFEVAPTAPGEMRLTISSAAGVVLVSQPFRVR